RYERCISVCRSIWSTRPPSWFSSMISPSIGAFSGVCSSLNFFPYKSKKSSVDICGGWDRLDIQEAHVLGVLLDEVTSGLDVLAHQHGENLIRSCGVIHGDLAQGAVLGIHGGVPQFRVVHLAQTLVALDAVVLGQALVRCLAGEQRIIAFLIGV